MLSSSRIPKYVDIQPLIHCVVASEETLGLAKENRPLVAMTFSIVFYKIW